ncbi:hypothetical protein EVA_08264 [gut metagenome]|uniref:Uncharacterized protein n=1 Tax=gut metagenome TaxID=749906 RepID=J9GTH2_9ZZZZ
MNQQEEESNDGKETDISKERTRCVFNEMQKAGLHQMHPPLWPA